MKIAEKLSPRQKKLIKKWLTNLKTIGQGDNLNKLAEIYGTDKWGSHFYTQHYATHFKPFRHKKFNLLEIGVGGYKMPTRGGESLRMWKRYFPKANVFSIDIFDKSQIQENRITIFKGSQVDKDFLNHEVLPKIGPLDIIIDDGSHINEHVIETFNILFPVLNMGGIYVIEDVHTSYWPRFGGSSTDLNAPYTIMNYFKGLTDCLNHVDVIRDNYEATYMDKHIISIHFYHNLIFIYKGENNEPCTKTTNRE